MPLYIDVHELKGVTAAAVAHAHAADMEKQGAHKVEYIKYWVNESCGKVFCLVDAPNPEAAACVHQEAHGLLAGRILEVSPEVAEAMMGGGATNSGGAAMSPLEPQALDTGTRTILFTDIVNSTALAQQLGDKAAVDLVRLHDAIVQEAISGQFGRKVKHTGDGIMASFVTAPSAVRCALRIQQELGAHNLMREGRNLKVRIGAAAGEPLEHQGDFFGSTVNLAARLCAYAQPAQTVVSGEVVGMCAGEGLRFNDLGEVVLKGFDQGVRAHAVSG
jgi:class 3 adenylate cyclase